MKKIVIILILIFLFLRIVVSFIFELHPDEAYYYLWSKKLDFSYFDHPPMVAYFIKLTTIFSDKEFFVRFSAIVCYIFSNFFLYKLVTQFFPQEVSYLSLLIFNIFPVSSLGFIITPDIPLLFFTILFLYFLSFALEYNKLRYWILSGIFCGLALLSKYNGVFLIISLFFTILFVKEYRKYIFTVYPYLVCTISFVLFLPVIIWNYNHGWVSFKFQFLNRLSIVESGSFSNILTYLFGQVVSLGIFLGIICFYVTIKSLLDKERMTKFLSIYAFLPILFFGIISYKKPAEMNWPLCGYPAVAVLVANYFYDKKSLKKYLLYPSAVVCLILIFILYTHGIFRVIPLEKFNPVWTLTDPTNWFYGWEEFAKVLEKENLEYPIVTTNHQLASELLYYSNKLNVFYNEQQFAIWNKKEKLPEKFYFINYESDVKTPSPQQKGINAEFIKSYDVFRKGFRIRTYHLYLTKL